MTIQSYIYTDAGIDSRGGRIIRVRMLTDMILFACTAPYIA